MQNGERPKSRHTKASSLYEEWAAEREAWRLRLIRQVELAFADVRLGGGTSLHQARAMDDRESDETIAAVRALDTEERWQDISDEKLNRLSDTLPFMDTEGFRFHIPRFMLFALKHEASDSGARHATIYSADMRGPKSERLERLSHAQREAIQVFFVFYSDTA